MNHRIVWLLAVAFGLAFLWPDPAEARGFGRRGQTPTYRWHAGYYDPQWAGLPHALVVPPTVHNQIKYQWGAGGTSRERIWPQYSAGPGGWGVGGASGWYRPAPVQPSHTDQMGTYYIRAPRD